MDLIKVLPEILINKIAAGEVVERPASVVKELIENSIDAGADEINIEILHGGKKLIRVSDNGVGMSKEDALLALERHATSKIYEEKDLENIGTMGFRGEALPSIASVSKDLMITSEDNSYSGTRIEIEGGKVRKVSEAGPSKGTIMEIRDLFFNTPARLAFLKGINTELSHIVGAVESAALGHPEISFALSHNRKVILTLTKARDFRERINQIYGRGLIDNLLEVKSEPLSKENKRISLYGLISNPPYSRSDRSLQYIFINRRPVRNQVISHAISEGFQSLVMKDRYPAAFLYFEIDTKEVDVNVHPSKREVRFRSPSIIHDLIVRVIKETLSEKVPEEISQIERDKNTLDGVREALEKYMRRPNLNLVQQSEIDSGDKEIQIDLGLSLKSEGTVSNVFLHAFESYIVTSDKKGITIIDQHAAHERILYEKLKEERIEIQRLIVPEMVELSKKESVMLIERLEVLKSLGVEVEEFGDNTFIIRSIPALLGGEDPKRLLLDILAELEKGQGLSRIDELERIKTIIACHSAVRANQPLTTEEIAHLVEELKETELPHTCPHGRPTTIRFTLRDLEKLFKRK